MRHHEDIGLVRFTKLFQIAIFVVIIIGGWIFMCGK